jgi:hypothetical protein
MTTTASAVPSPSRSSSTPTPTPTPSDGLSGPGQFTAAWHAVTVKPTSCPAAHPTAVCYTVTGSGTLPTLGPATFTRTVIVGDGTASPPAGCVNADTTGTLANATGTLTFTAIGELCGKRSSFTVTSSRGNGAMAPDALHAVIINDASVTDAVTETWSGEVAQN